MGGLEVGRTEGGGLRGRRTGTGRTEIGAEKRPTSRQRDALTREKRTRMEEKETESDRERERKQERRGETAGGRETLGVGSRE